VHLLLEMCFRQVKKTHEGKACKICESVHCDGSLWATEGGGVGGGEGCQVTIHACPCVSPHIHTTGSPVCKDAYIPIKTKQVSINLTSFSAQQSFSFACKCLLDILT
jgi:hypothetical protein